jgi:hypothetical protein
MSYVCFALATQVFQRLYYSLREDRNEKHALSEHRKEKPETFTR